MKTNKNFKHIILLLALPLAFVLAPKSHAFDLKTWSGSMCSAFYGTQDKYFNRTHSGVINTSGTASYWVTCGLVDDTYNGFNSGDYNDGTQGARARIIQPAGSISTCYLSERGDFGQEIDTRMAVFTEPNQELSLDTAISDHWGSRLLLCRLAPGAKLVRLTVWEHDESDLGH